MVRDCEGIEIVINERKKQDVSAGLTDTSAFGIYSYGIFRFALFLSLESRIFLRIRRLVGVISRSSSLSMNSNGLFQAQDFRRGQFQGVICGRRTGVG